MMRRPRSLKAYKAQAAQNVCSAAGFGPSGTQACSVFSVGAPSREDKSVFSVEYARSVAGTGAARLAISYDASSAVTGIDLPVYVFTDIKGGLSGGVRFGYRSDTRRVSASLFVSEFKL